MGRKRWSEIDSFRILMSEGVAGVVVIEARKGENKKHMCLLFNDREVSPQQIRAALLQHLPPDKELT